MNGNSVKINMKAIKSEATEFLNKKGRRIELILCALVLVFTAVVPIFFYSYIVDFTFMAMNKADLNFNAMMEDIISVAVRVISCILSLLFVVFVTFPVYSSYFGFSYKLYRNGIAGNGEHFPNGKGYGHALSTGGILYGVLFVSLVPLVLLVDLGNLLFSLVNDEAFAEKILSKIKNEEISEYIGKLLQELSIADFLNAFFFVIIIVGLVLSFLVFLLFKPTFLVGYFIARGEKAGRAIKLSRERMRTARAKKIYGDYIKSFLPSLLISVVTLLTLFLIDTLPKMTVVYFEIADEIVYGE